MFFLLAGSDALRLWVFELLGGMGGESCDWLCDMAEWRMLVRRFWRGEEGRVFGGKNVGKIGGVGSACDFSRPLVRGDGGIYERGEGALQPIYMGKPV